MAPGDGRVIADLALVTLMCGDVAGSIARAREALEIDPTNAPARITLARALDRAGDVEGLVADLDAVMEAIARVRTAEWFRG